MTPKNERITREREVEVVQLVRGPDDGSFAEVPLGQREIWRWVTGFGYCLYARRQRARRIMTFRNEILSMDGMADYIAKHYDNDDPEQAPWVHVDAETPTARKITTYRNNRSQG